MNGERFYVAALSGYPVPIHPHIYDTGRAGTDWYVYDTAKACEIVAEFKGKLGRIRAYRLAWKLNRDEAQWEREHE